MVLGGVGGGRQTFQDGMGSAWGYPGPGSLLKGREGGSRGLCSLPLGPLTKTLRV